MRKSLIRMTFFIRSYHPTALESGHLWAVGGTGRTVMRHEEAYALLAGIGEAGPKEA